MPSLEQNLTTLGQGFSVISLPLPPGSNPRQFQFQLEAPGGRGGLSVVDDTVTNTIEKGPIKLSWLMKDVRFLKTDITDDTILGGMPITDLLQLNVGSVTTGAPVPPGVPGVIGALEGTIPVVTQSVGKTFNVTVDVRWRVRDELGNSDQTVSWTLSSGGQIAQGTGGDIVAPPTQGLAILDIVLNTLFTELTAPSPTFVLRRFVEASVRLSAGAASSGWLTLPPVDVLPLVMVPTVTIMFTDTQFKDLALIVVPGNSPLDEPAVTAALNTLNTALGVLGTAAAVAGFFIAELAVVSTALQNAKRITFRKTDAIPNLRDVELEPTSISDWNGTVASDEMSSLILLACPNRQLRCFNDTDYQAGQGKFAVTSSESLLVEVRDLHPNPPASNPAPALQVVQPPSGWNWSLAHSINKFGDEISSVQFGWQ